MSLTEDRNDPGLSVVKDNGQQESYLVLSREEIAKGFKRPVRVKYIHVKCGTETVMHRTIAETYARDPEYYGGTFCHTCGAHFDLVENDERQFHWEDGTGVGE